LIYDSRTVAKTSSPRQKFFGVTKFLDSFFATAGLALIRRAFPPRATFTDRAQIFSSQ
jgi:hypothetical protein